MRADRRGGGGLVMDLPATEDNGSVDLAPAFGR